MRAFPCSFLTVEPTFLFIFYLEKCERVNEWVKVSQSCLTLCDPMDCSPPGSSIHGDSPGKNTGVGACSLLQGAFPTQRSNLGLPHCRWILYPLSLQGEMRFCPICVWAIHWWGFPGGSSVKNPPASAGDTRDAGSIPGSGRFHRGHGNPLQCPCLENLVDRGAWWATVHDVSKNPTRLKWLCMYIRCSVTYMWKWVCLFLYFYKTPPPLSWQSLSF